MRRSTPASVPHPLRGAAFPAIRAVAALALLLALCATAGPARAQTNVGTTAAQFLKIESGPRAVAMGGNFVALSDDASALFWNPAGAANILERRLTFGHTEWFAGITHNYFALVVPGTAGAIGISVVALNTGEMEQTTVEEPEGTGIRFDFSDLAFGVTYARPLTDRFSVGITGKYVTENAFNENASTFAVDLGTLLEIGYRGLRIGMSISNFGGRMRLDGRDLIQGQDLNGDGTDETQTTLVTNDWPLPLTFRVGTVLDVVGLESGVWVHPESRLTVEVDGIHPNDNDERMGVGAEYAWRETLFLRGGTKVNHDVEDFTWGGGVRISADRFSVGVDYAYSNLGDLDAVQRFALSIDF